MHEAPSYSEVRRDETVQIAIVVRTGGVVWSDRLVRRSSFERRHIGGRWASSRRVCDGGKPPRALAMLWPENAVLHDALASVLDRVRQGVTCALRWEARLRTLTNSEGHSERRIETWWDVSVQDRDARVSDGCSSSEELSAVLRACISNLGIARPDVNPVRPPGRTDLLLSPTVACVLIHELIAHGIEEGVIEDPEIGPSTLDVEVPASGVAYDDEALPRVTLRLVHRGRIAQPSVRDRRDATLHGGQPTGVALVSSHGGHPRPRLTRIAVKGGDSTFGDIAAVRCLGVSAALHERGVATLRIDRAADGTGHPVGPFSVVMDTPGLLRHLVAVGRTPERARSGRCVKYGDALPCVGDAPWLLLEGTTLAP